MFGLIHGGSLPTIVEEEFQNIVTKFRSLFLVEHNEDGTHRASPEVTNFVPPGAVMPYAGSTAPDHWLLCDGSQVNRNTYSRLFSIIGVTYGVGDGSTTFNLPDTRGRFLLSKSAAGTGSVLAATGGALDHTHSGGSHTHSISSSGTHTHSVTGNTANESAHTHSVTIDVGGVATSRTETVDQNLDGATQPGVLIENGIDTHTHNDDTATTSAGSAHNHGAGTLAAAAGGDHNHGGATGASSGSTGAENPAYIVVNYIIKT